jgi:hypothetical protein
MSSQALIPRVRKPMGVRKPMAKTDLGSMGIKQTLLTNHCKVNVESSTTFHKYNACIVFHP